MDAMGEAQWHIALIRCFQVMPFTLDENIAQLSLRELRSRPTNWKSLVFLAHEGTDVAAYPFHSLRDMSLKGVRNETKL